MTEYDETPLDCYDTTPYEGGMPCAVPPLSVVIARDTQGARHHLRLDQISNIISFAGDSPAGEVDAIDVIGLHGGLLGSFAGDDAEEIRAAYLRSHGIDEGDTTGETELHLLLDAALAECEAIREAVITLTRERDAAMGLVARAKAVMSDPRELAAMLTYALGKSRIPFAGPVARQKKNALPTATTGKKGRNGHG
jgi:hypothetical protein